MISPNWTVGRLDSLHRTKNLKGGHDLVGAFRGAQRRGIEAQVIGSPVVHEVELAAGGAVPAVPAFTFTPLKFLQWAVHAHPQHS